MKQSDKIISHLRGFVTSNRADIILPNFFHGFYEMDLFKLNERGYITEYEIKISRSDYFNDFKKGKDFLYDKERSHLKHDKIKAGEIANRFFFVVPEKLIAVNEVPDHCGLIYFIDGKYPSFNIVKSAKLIHKNKFTEYRELCHKMSFMNQNIRIQLGRYKKGCPKCDDLKLVICDLNNDLRVARNNLEFFNPSNSKT